MVFRIKAIKPAKMKIDTIRQELLNELRAEGRDLQAEYRKTSATWNGAKPDYPIDISLAGGNASVSVAPSGTAEALKKWHILDGGSRPHIIKPRRARRLRFRAGGFRAKTRPGSLQSGRGAAASGPYRYPKQVRHPGTQARGWSKTIQRQNQRRFPKRINAAIGRGARKLYK